MYYKSAANAPRFHTSTKKRPLPIVRYRMKIWLWSGRKWSQLQAVYPVITKYLGTKKTDW